VSASRQPVVLAQTQNPESAVCDGQTQAMEQKLKPSVIAPPIVETDFARLEDGSLLEMIEDPENSSRAVFVMYKNGEARIVDHVQSAERILKPFHREAEIIRHVRLPRGVKPYDSVESLLSRMNQEIFSRCLDLENHNRFLLACFVLSTWFIDCDRMPVAPYLALVGLPASGKSAVLRILRLLCRRSILTADISSAAFYRACERLTPTLLIDETATAGKSRDLFHLLRTGISRDLVALRKDQSFRAYGAKAVAWTELPRDSALNSRCVIILMHETTRQDLKSPNDPDILAVADDMQKQFLQYRLEKFTSLTPPQITDNKFPLRSRFRDLYNALGLAIAANGRNCDRLLRYLKCKQYSNLEPLLPHQAAVLQTLFRIIHLEIDVARGISDLTTKLSAKPRGVSDLTAKVNADLEESGESLRLTPRKVGAALTSLGITRRCRTNQGWWVYLDRDAQKRIHHLVEIHGLDSTVLLPPSLKCTFCDLCDPSYDLRNFPGYV